jgi:hypothetical protein
MRGDVTGLASSCHHVPILRVWVATILRLTPTPRKPVAADEHKVRAARPHGFVEEAWDFASRRYGLSRRTLEDLEAQMSRIEQLPVVLRHPAWRVIVERDA